ncbi:MAG: alpha/beta hydrolase family protein [Thalassovita sp.]
MVALVGCSSRVDFVAELIAPKSSVDTIALNDETFSLVSYRTSDTSNASPVFFIGGSGCTSLRAYLGTYFSAAPEGLEIIGLEKTGVSDRATGSSCSDEFWQSYTYDDLLRRNIAALDHIAQRFDVEKIPLIGTSEGGALALEIAASTDRVDRLALLGAGAMSQRQELRLLFDKRGQQQAIETVFERIDATPQSVEQTELGLPHRYWVSVLDHDPTEYASNVSAPTLIIIGQNDQNVPVASARLANALIKTSELIIWPDADHTFDTPSGNQRDAVVSTAVRFVIGAPWRSVQP